MKEVVIHEGPRAEQVERAIPKAESGQLVIKVEVSGSNPKDWKTWWVPDLPINMGDDFAGTVHDVGADITEFSIGDRVFAFHEVQAPHGSYAEYAVAHAYTTAHLPTNTSFEEAATIPLAAMTASLSLYRSLCLPQPWAPASQSCPLLIYGGSSAVGAFAIKLAQWSQIHPIIAIAGAGSDYVSTLLDFAKGDTVLDYRKGDAALEEGIAAALASTGSTGILHALDAIASSSTSQLCLKLLSPGGVLAHVLPLDKDVSEPTKGRAARLTMVGDVHGAFGEKPGARLFGHIMMRAFARGLETGEFRGHPFEVVPGGLGAVSEILARLKEGRASAIKYVFRIGETEEL